MIGIAFANFAAAQHWQLKVYQLGAEIFTACLSNDAVIPSAPLETVQVQGFC